MKLTLGKIAEFISASGRFAPGEVARAYSIDSRTMVSGELFFAVKGERLDGHDFVEQALAKGAVAAVVRKDQLRRPLSAAGSAAGCRRYFGRTSDPGNYCAQVVG